MLWWSTLMCWINSLIILLSVSAFIALRRTGFHRLHFHLAVFHQHDEGALRATLQATLDSVDPARPDALGRRSKRRLQAPYYVVKITGALFHTQGGLDIDAHCRVRRADGSVLPNLLAAGGAARGVSGNDAWGYLAGNGLLSAVGGGWVAATTLIEQRPG